MPSERASPRRRWIRLPTLMGTLAALLLLSCGGRAVRPDGGGTVVGSSGTDESRVAGAGGQRQIVAGSGGAKDPAGGAGGLGGTPANPDAGAGAGGFSVCASKTVETRARRIAFEFVVEASESMKQPALGSTLSRWQVVKDALAGFAQWVPPLVALGLVVIPADGECSTASVEVPLAPTTPEHASIFLDALDAIEPGGGEPAHEAVTVAIDELVEHASLINAASNLVLVLDDIPSPTAQCVWGTDARDALILGLRDAVDTNTIRRLVIFGLPDSEQTRESLVSLSDDVQQGSFVDCGLPMPRACDGWVASGPVTLEDGFKALLYDSNPPDQSCTVRVPALLDNPSVDSSQLTLRLTEDGETTQSLTVARDQDCIEGWRLEDRGDAVTLCGSLCQEILGKMREVDLTVEYQFSCI